MKQKMREQQEIQRISVEKNSAESAYIVEKERQAAIFETKK
jgi:hypothetical protein